MFKAVTKKFILVALVALFLVGIFSGYGLFREQENEVVHCVDVSVQETDRLADRIDLAKENHETQEFDLNGFSTEGGVQSEYFDPNSGAIELITQVFFGETGKSDTRYYLKEGQVFLIKKTNSEYEFPLSESSEGSIKSVTTKRFYLSSQEQLCSLYNDGVAQSITLDDIELANFLILSTKN